MAVRRVEHPSLPATDTAPGGLAERVLRFGRGSGVAGAIAFFWAGAFVLAWFVVPYVWVRARGPLERRRLMQRVVAASFRFFHRLLERTRLYRYEYAGTAPPEEVPAVIIANHPSLLDVTSIIARMPHVCCVVKESLVENVFVGRLLRSCGHVSAGNGSLGASLLVLESLQRRLDEGFPVLVFPEGTRSPKNGMHPFRRGAFEVARKAEVPVVPLFLTCTPPALGKGTPVWQHPLACPTLRVHVDDAIDMRDQNPGAMCGRVDADFRRRLGLGESHGEGVA